MTNSQIQLKFKQRLNKGDSLDYDNLYCWQISEAYNKAQLMWARRQIEGINQSRTGSEQTSSRIDDLQILLTEELITFKDKGEYWESCSFPDNYLGYKKISAKCDNSVCEPRTLRIYLAPVGDVDMLLTDALHKPSFDWSETFSTMIGNKIRIYTNGEFKVCDTYLTYYREPVKIAIKGCIDLATELTIAAGVESEFKEDIIDIIVDEAIKILAGDLESTVQYQISDANVKGNT